jgi:hypothetical protein
MRRFILSMIAIALGLTVSAPVFAQVPGAKNVARQLPPDLLPAFGQSVAAGPFGALLLDGMRKASAPGVVAGTPRPKPEVVVPPGAFGVKPQPRLPVVPPLVAPAPVVAKVDPSAISKRAGQKILAKPDLAVLSVTVKGKEAVVNFKNIGTANASVNRMNLQAKRGGKLLASEFGLVSSLGAGKSSSMTFSTTVDLDIPGTRIEVKVDDGGVIEESDEANNTFVKIIATPALAELIFETVEFGRGGEVRVLVKNVGGSAAPAFNVKRQFFKADQDRGFSTLRVPGLAAGETSRLLTFFGSANPVDRMEITIDDLNEVREANESNNRFSKRLP